MPEFGNLYLLKAVQSIAGTKTEYANWFEALDYMENEMDKFDYEIALIGCGAYGMNLAAHAKSKEKQLYIWLDGHKCYLGYTENVGYKINLNSLNS